MHDLFTRGVTAAGKLRPPREASPGALQRNPHWLDSEEVGFSKGVRHMSSYYKRHDTLKF